METRQRADGTMKVVVVVEEEGRRGNEGENKAKWK